MRFLGLLAFSIFVAIVSIAAPVSADTSPNLCSDIDELTSANYVACIKQLLQTWTSSFVNLNEAIQQLVLVENLILESCNALGHQNCDIAPKTPVLCVLSQPVQMQCVNCVCAPTPDANLAIEKINLAIDSTELTLSNFHEYANKMTELRDNLSVLIKKFESYATNTQITDRFGEGLLKRTLYNLTLLNQLLIKIERILFGPDRIPSGDETGNEGTILCVLNQLQDADDALTDTQPHNLIIAFDFLKGTLECSKAKKSTRVRLFSVNRRACRTGPWAMVNAIFRKLLPRIAPNPIRAGEPTRLEFFSLSLNTVVLTSNLTLARAALPNGVYLVETKNGIKKIILIK